MARKQRKRACSAKRRAGARRTSRSRRSRIADKPSSLRFERSWSCTTLKRSRWRRSQSRTGPPCRWPTAGARGTEAEGAGDWRRHRRRRRYRQARITGKIAALRGVPSGRVSACVARLCMQRSPANDKGCDGSRRCLGACTIRPRGLILDARPKVDVCQHQ